MLRLLAQFMVVPVLARLLSPTDSGIVGSAMPFMLIAMILDAGPSQARPDQTDDEKPH